MTDWYNLHHKTARGLILIIARSHNVIKITAGKLFHLSIATFGDVSNDVPFLCLINKKLMNYIFLIFCFLKIMIIS